MDRAPAGARPPESLTVPTRCPRNRKAPRLTPGGHERARARRPPSRRRAGPRPPARKPGLPPASQLPAPAEVPAAGRRARDGAVTGEDRAQTLRRLVGTVIGAAALVCGGVLVLRHDNLGHVTSWLLPAM